MVILYHLNNYGVICYTAIATAIMSLVSYMNFPTLQLAFSLFSFFFFLFGLEFYLLDKLGLLTFRLSHDLDYWILLIKFLCVI